MRSRCFIGFLISGLGEPNIYTINRFVLQECGEVSAENTKSTETFTKSIRKYNPPSYFCGLNQSNISNNAQNSFKNYLDNLLLLQHLHILVLLMSQVLTLQEQSMFKTGNLWLFDEVEKNINI